MMIRTLIKTIRFRVERFLLVLTAISLVACSGEDALNKANVAEATDGTKLTVTLVRASDGSETTAINSSNPGKVVATLKSSSGSGIAGVLVTFSTSSGFATFSPSSGTALTNSAGVAEVQLVAGTEAGAGSVSVSLSINEEELAAQIGYTVGISTSSGGGGTSSDSDVGSIEFVSASPDSIVLKGTGGTGLSETSILTFKVRGIDGSPLSNQMVSFVLNSDIGGATLSPATRTSNIDGEVTTVVNGGTLPGSIRVTASVTTTDASGVTRKINSQSDQLSISTGIPDQDSISISAELIAPEAFNFDGESVAINIRLGDHYNNFVPDGTTVYFTSEGGSIEPSCQTVAGGCKVAWVSGEPRPANHRVTILATAIGNESFVDKDVNGKFTSADGEPYKDVNNNDIFDEAFTDANSNGKFDEPYVDNTLFTMNTNGVYDLAIDSFTDYNSNGVYDGDGTNAGETVFVDSNGNGIYDGAGVLAAGEAYTDLNSDSQFNGPGYSDLGEAFLDTNENGVRESTELFFDANNNGVYDKDGDGKYNGILCDASEPNCSTERTVHVRDSLVLIMAGSTANITVRDLLGNEYSSGTPVNADGVTKTLYINISDSAGQSMPSSTSVKITSDIGVLGGATDFKFAGSNNQGGAWLTVSITDDDIAVNATGSINILVTTPKGLQTSKVIGLSL